MRISELGRGARLRAPTKCRLVPMGSGLRENATLKVRTLCVGFMVLLLAACGAGNATPISLVPSVMPKLLATVFISPTPNADEREATRVATTPTAAPPTNVVPTATVYVGVFLGEAQDNSDGGAVLSSSPLDNLPTADAGLSATACPAQADVVFGTGWQGDATASNALGCPIELASSLNGVVQVFEHGVMYNRPSGEIWAIAPSANRFWYYPVALPPPPGDMPPPPAGLAPPSQTFSTIWRSVQGLSDTLGYARTGNQESSITTQRFQGGTLLADGSSGQIFVLLADGRAYGPY